jgi:hypothetical protein
MYINIFIYLIGINIFGNNQIKMNKFIKSILRKNTKSRSIELTYKK